MYNQCLIDLHLHIDGALSVDTAMRLADMPGTILPSEKKEALFHLLTAPADCKSLNDYLTRFDLPCSLMQTRETISEAVYRIQEELKANGVIYAELRFAPQLHTNLGLTQEDVVLAALDGLNRSDLRANLILCCMRGNDNKEANIETIRLADVYQESGVVAIDLAGAEGLYPTSDFADIFDYAKALHLKFVIHAGEADGARSIQDAVHFGASRIGHGIHCVEDVSVMQQLKERQIPLELCITSNLQTKAVTNIENYPLRRLMEYGVPITLNTDNPTVSNTSMKKEIVLAKQHFKLTDEEIKQLLLNSVHFSFADEQTKAELQAIIENCFR